MSDRSQPDGRLTWMLGLGLLAGAGSAWLVSRQRARRDFPADGRATAVVTGASSGIGAEYARVLAGRGYDLVLVARREERLEDLAAELRGQHGVTVEVIAADLARPEDVALVEQRVGELPDLEILVNNAGFGTHGRFGEADLEPQLDMIQVHVLASVRLTRAALPGMAARGRGAVVNVASLAGWFPLVGSATYSATKSYLITFSEALDLELRGTGVRVQALCPGMTHSEFHAREMLRATDHSWIPGFLWMTSREVAEASFAGLQDGQVVCVPGLLNKGISLIERSLVLGRLAREASRVVLRGRG